MLEYLLSNNSQSQSFPKYDVYLDKNNDIFLEIALAGYSKEDLEVLYEFNTLTIKTKEDYKKESSDDNTKKYLYQSLAKRKFKISFEIKRGYQIKTCELKEGLLKIQLNYPDDIKSNSLVEISS